MWRLILHASAWSGCNPLEVNFDGTATNENEYYWYIDDKVFSNYEDPYYRFVNESPVNKTFNVQFRAVSLNGCSDDTIKQVTLYPQPIAEFLPDPQVQDFNTTTDITIVTMTKSYRATRVAGNITGNSVTEPHRCIRRPPLTKLTIPGVILQ